MVVALPLWELLRRKLPPEHQNHHQDLTGTRPLPLTPLMKGGGDNGLPEQMHKVSSRMIATLPYRSKTTHFPGDILATKFDVMSEGFGRNFCGTLTLRFLHLLPEVLKGTLATHVQCTR